MDAKIWEFIARTDIWTGDIDGGPDRLITTGILGSIRWWFEVVVRGLGGYACDPSNTRCEVSDKSGRVRKNCCVVCNLFGCTGWARKFRFDVLDENDRPRTEQIKKDDKFRLRFTPLRPIRDEEWALLDLTLRLTVDYGAIGGKTVYKPTEEDQRQAELHHQDFGLVKLVGSEPIGTSKAALRSFVHNGRRTGSTAWPSTESMWCVHDRYIARETATASSFNQTLGRKQSKAIKEKKGRRIVRRSDFLEIQNDAVSRWLSGGRGESKKVISFRDPARTFGFVKPDTISHDAMLERLKVVWDDMEDGEYVQGIDILDKLLESREGLS